MKPLDSATISLAPRIVLLFLPLVLGACAPSSKEAGGSPPEQREQDEHVEEGRGGEPIQLSPDELEELGIRVEAAGRGTLSIEVTFPGEVRPNLDRYAHIVPRVSGIVRSVSASIGDLVEGGRKMAILESRELADAHAAYLAAVERLALAETNAAREERLFGKKISSEQEYLEAKQALAEARISLRSAAQKLMALGFSAEYVERLPELPEGTLTEYSLTAPFTGTVLDKHIVLGEALEANSEAFTLADLRSVWIDLSIYQKDLSLVAPGQSVRVVARPGGIEADGTIAYLRPIVGEETRTGLARVVLPNAEGRWQPGMFVNGTVEVTRVDVPLVVPRTALQTIESRDVLFVRGEEGFEARTVSIGRFNRSQVEITGGLAEGELYAATGAFAFKSELGKGELGEGHEH